MVSFNCDGCLDVVKKPKLDQHFGRCRSTFTCIDCSKTFQKGEWKSHTSCISEAEKYEKSLYKGKKGANGTKSVSMTPTPVATPTSQPVSIVSEIQDAIAKPVNGEQQASDKPVVDSANGKKRKRDNDKVTEEPKSNGASKSKTKKAKATSGLLSKSRKELQDYNTSMKAAVQQVLQENKKPLSITKLRKKAVKLFLANPENTASKDELRSTFDDSLQLTLETDTIKLY